MDEQEVLAAKQKLRQHRVSQNFDRKYRQRGGVAQLHRMLNNADTLSDIGAWFGITSSRVSMIVTDIIGVPYSTYLANRNISRSGVIKETANE